MTSYRSSNRRKTTGIPTAVLIDYNNLYEEIDATLDGDEFPDEIILDMLALLPDYVRSEWGGSISVMRAYGDFGLVEDGGTFVLQQLSQRGIDPRMVVSQDDEAAARIRLCIETADLINRRSDIGVFVVLTGSNSFDTLASFVSHRGHRLSVLTTQHTDETSETNHPLLSVGTAAGLLSEALDGGAPQPAAVEIPARRPEDYLPLSDDIARRAIEIVDDHFGQYEEVYLTPLLRKLTELLGDTEEPKSVVADLRDAGAILLEKRRGYPHDYTVLILDRNHPDVRELVGGVDDTADLNLFGEEASEQLVSSDAGSVRQPVGEEDILVDEEGDLEDAELSAPDPAQTDAFVETAIDDPDDDLLADALV